jgi:hypothetical protein
VLFAAALHARPKQQVCCPEPHGAPWAVHVGAGWQVLLKAALQLKPVQHVCPEPHDTPWVTHPVVGGWHVLFANVLHVVPGQHVCPDAHDVP